MAKTESKDTAPTRDVGKNSQGEVTIYPSDVDSVARSYNLTGPEAERLILGGKVNDKEADKIKGERVVFRQHYEYVTNPTSNPMALAESRQNEREERDTKAEAERIATDKTSPEAGPYGPDAVYTGVGDAPVDTDHTSPQNPEDVK